MGSNASVRPDAHWGPSVLSRRRTFRAAAMFVVVLISGSTGCTVFDNLSQSFRYNDTFNDAATKYRHRSMATRNWHRHKNRFCNEACLSDFAAGYRQAYEDVASGGSGCTPNFPPRDYWGWQYQSSEGQKKVAAWFAGYPHGARAAEEEGVGNWSQIQMSSNLQAQYVTAGKLPNQGHAVYPITPPAKSGNATSVQLGGQLPGPVDGVQATMTADTSLPQVPQR